jgi:hypothetical protein
MNPTVLGYFGFIVAALILIWATLEFRARLTRFRAMNEDKPDAWVKLDSTRADPTPEEALLLPPSDDADDPDDDDDEQEEEKPKQNIQIRARQNGHYTESKKPL